MHRCLLSWQFLLICIWKLVTSVSLGCITLHRCIIVRRKEQSKKQSLIQGVEMANHNHYLQPPPQVRYGQSPAASGFFSQHSQQSQPAREPRDLTPLSWLSLYLAGTIVGMTGLCSLLYTTFRKDETIRNLTYGFGATMTIIPIMVAIYWYVHHLNLPGDGHRKWILAFCQTLGGSVLAFAAVFGFFSSLYCDLVLGSIAKNIYGLPSGDFAPLYWAWFIAKRLPMLSF
ncbi:hypothetical protein EK21DRAFT_66986 [Setomelanomma holmii]|uniref:Uncharacterized protein n=1 Tax=Setomelanomma holmii TaxID=210430 RepID=A0A9P4H8U4_9PLEO|nr:hypothetical protein EK21DRAFT_66986 [Setomelanomma holmii]